MQRADLRRARRGSSGLSVAESEARHRALVEALPDGAVLQDADGSVLAANPAACALLGVSLDELLGNPRGGPAPVPAPRPAPDHAPGHDLLAPAHAVLTDGVSQHRIVAVERDGRTTKVEVTAVPLLSDDGRVQAVVSSLVDVLAQEPESGPEDAASRDQKPDQKPDQDGVTRRGEDMFRLTMAHSPIGFGLAALNGRFVRVNRRLCRMLGYRADELLERTIYDVLHPDDVEDTSVRMGELLRGGVDSVQVERRYRGHGGMRLQGSLAATLVRDDSGRPLHFILQIEDLSEIRKAQDLLTHMALHDPLTGLANRALIVDRISEALDAGRRTGRRVAVLLADLDHFRVINDSAGHEIGDLVLVEVGRRIARSLSPGDVAGRLGGDEFVVVCGEIVDEHEAVVVAERLRTAIGEPLNLGDRTVVPTASIGIAISSAPGVDPLTLIRDADIATYRAKERGRDRWDVVDVAVRSRAMERLDLEHTLRAALDSGELRLHFQPIVDLTTQAVVGREALLRWQHPDRGLIAPGEFLHVAEESGLISEIGHWVLREAARAAAAAGDAEGYVSINVSPHQVARPGLTDTVEKALRDAGLPAERLVVELTESVMLSAAPGARQEIAQLDELGVRVVVDDFGTGFSALSYLRDLPVSGIKVDRSFTAGLGRDGHCDRIVEALTGLGRGIGVDVIVEGVETEEQRLVLAGMGAEHAQGYLFGRPAPGFGG